MKYVESLNKSLHKSMHDFEEVLMLGEDIADPYGGAFKVTKGLKDKFGDRVLSTPISESAITGIGTGLALGGFKPIVEIMFGDFITLCVDQLVNGASKFPWMYGGNFELPLMIRTPMGARRGYGPTHSQTLESILFNIPGIEIISPSVYHNPGNILYNTINNLNLPTIFIENKTSYPFELQKIKDGKIGNFFVNPINNESNELTTYSFILDKDSVIDATLITYGGMATIALEAAQDLYYEEELNVEVLVPSRIKPIPRLDIIDSIKKSKRLVIAEESVKVCGWGSMVISEIMNDVFDELNVSPMLVGSKEYPIGSSEPLENKIIPQKENLYETLKKVMK